MIKKNYILFVTCILLLFIAWQLLEAVAVHFFADSNVSYYGIKIFSDLFLVTIFTILCFKYFREFNFQFKVTSSSGKLLLLTIGFITFALSNKSLNVVGVSSTFFAAASEEFVFRGIIMPTFLVLFIKSENRILHSILACSLLFGCIHLLHLVRFPEQWIGIIFQSIGAFTLSMILCYAMIKSSNLILVTLFHFAVNLVLKNADRSNNPLGFETSTEAYSYDILGLAFTFGFIVLVNVYLLIKIQSFEKNNYTLNLN